MTANNKKGFVLVASVLTLVAWRWDSAYAPSGDSLTYQICDSHFTAAEESEIQKAGNAWTAGPGRDIRGALWELIRGPNRAQGTCFLDNGVNEVYTRTDAWFTNRGLQNAGAVCVCNNSDGNNDADIAFRDSVNWVTKKDSKRSVGERSLGQVAVHEFGHQIGFLHENNVLATMNGQYPGSGDIGESKHRISEDDYVGLTVKRSDSSTGKNFMLGRYRRTGSGTSAEVWNKDNSPYQGAWTVCQTVYPLLTGPDMIHLMVHGTGFSYTQQVDWWLSPEDDCQSGGYTVGQRVLNLSSNTPDLIHPEPYDFTAVPAGQYILCAKVDPDDLTVETNEWDNLIKSEVKVTVEACP